MQYQYEWLQYFSIQTLHSPLFSDRLQCSMNNQMKLFLDAIHGIMLMYGKEASDRKQEIDRQHYAIPNQRSQRPKDKHCGNVHNWLWNHG